MFYLGFSLFWVGLAGTGSPHFHGNEGVEDTFSGPLVELAGSQISPFEFKSRQALPQLLCDPEQFT